MRELSIPSLSALRNQDSNGIQPLKRELERQGYLVQKIVDLTKLSSCYSSNGKPIVTPTSCGMEIDIKPTYTVKTLLIRHPRTLSSTAVFLIEASIPKQTATDPRKRSYLASRPAAKAK